MFVIHNPTAGRRNVRRLRAVLDALTGAGVRVRLLETRYGGHAELLAREAVAEGTEMIVAAGGDGTIAETVAGMVGQDGGVPRLGVIPLGTANVLAHEYRLPTRPEAQAALLASDANLPLWPGIMRTEKSTRLFVQMVGAGFDAHVVHQIDLRTKRYFGRGAYVYQTLRELGRYGFPRMTVRVDGRDFEAASVIASKGRLYGGPYVLAPDALPGAPGFVVTLFAEGSRAAALRAGLALPRGRMAHLPGVVQVRGRKIEILTPKGVPIQADGDAAGLVALSVEDAANPIMLAAPGPRG